MKKHLAIFTSGAGELILNGEKTIESRFSKRKDSPFGQISGGDLVYIKPTGKDIIGQFKVKKVIFYDVLEPEDFKDIREKYGKELAIDENFWQRHENARYGTLIFIGVSSKFITSPIKIPKKDLRGWVILP